MNFWWFILIAIVVIAIAVQTASKGKQSKSRKEKRLPYRTTPNMFTKSEASFYGMCQRKLPVGYHVFPKVRLADIVDITVSRNDKNYMSYFGRISQKHVDFLICDPEFRPRVVVEIDGSSHNRSRQRQSDQTKDAVLNAADLPLVRLKIGATWDMTAVTRYLDEATPQPNGKG